MFDGLLFRKLICGSRGSMFLSAMFFRFPGKVSTFYLNSVLFKLDKLFFVVREFVGSAINLAPNTTYTYIIKLVFV